MRENFSERVAAAIAIRFFGSLKNCSETSDPGPSTGGLTDVKFSQKYLRYLAWMGNMVNSSMFNFFKWAAFLNFLLNFLIKNSRNS